MTEWSHLPNAKYIDLVIESIKKHPNEWEDGYNIANNICYSAYIVAHNASYNAVRVSAHGSAAIGDALLTALHLNSAGVYSAASDAILALIAHDDSSQYLHMSSDQLKAFITLSERPACILMLPAVIALEKTGELAKVA